jgi:hypothetical protein
LPPSLLFTPLPSLQNYRGNDNFSTTARSHGSQNPFPLTHSPHPVLP